MTSKFGLNPKLPRDGKKHPPLRSTQELADEFGIPLRSLIGFLKNRNGPQAVFVVRYNSRRSGNGPQRTYYNHVEARRWWAGVKDTL